VPKKALMAAGPVHTNLPLKGAAVKKWMNEVLKMLMLDKKLRKSSNEAGRKIVEERFSWGKITLMRKISAESNG